MDDLPESQPKLTNKANEDDVLDPRIQIEIERLNDAGEAINRLEAHYSNERQAFEDFRETTGKELYELEQHIGEAVQDSKKYYEARIRLRKAKENLMKAKHRFERAQTLHIAAKEIATASADLMSEADESNQESSLWNETYKQAMEKAEEAASEKYQADVDQQFYERVCYDLEVFVLKLQKEYKRSINKSKPYYEKKAAFHQELDFQKTKIDGLERCIAEAKKQYEESLRNLEHISNEIHQQRNQNKLEKEIPTVMAKDLPSAASTTDDKKIELFSKHDSNDILRSCLLRTENLPAGVFTNAYDPLSSILDETEPDKTDFNDQFILCSKEPPRPTFIVDSKQKETSTVTRPNAEEVSANPSQTENDDTDLDSLHVLSDDQLRYLPSESHSH